MSQVAEQMSEGKLKILKATADLLEEPGQRLTVNRIARQVSVTDAAIYRHYRSKEDIFSALMNYMEANFLTPLGHAQQKDVLTRSEVEAICRQHMDFLIGHPGLARMLLGQANTEASGVSDKVKLLNAKIRSQFAQLLKWGQMKKHFVLKLRPELAADFIYGQLLAVAMACVFDLPAIDDDMRLDMIMQTVFE